MAIIKKLAAPIIALALIGVALLTNAADIGAFFPKFFGAISPVFAGFCIAFVANLVLNLFEKLWDKIFAKAKKKCSARVRRGVCLALSEVLIIGSVVLVIFVVVPHIARAVSTFVSKLPDYAENLNLYWLKIHEFFAKLSITLPDSPLDGERLTDRITELLSKYGNTIVNKAVDFTLKAGTTAVNIIVAGTISIYVLLRKEQLGAQTKKLLRGLFSDRHYNKITEFFSLCNECFSNFVTGQLAEVVINTLLCLCGMLILRMPYALMISVLVGVTALIPIFGAFIGSGAGALLILIADPKKALWFIIFIIAMQQVDGNIIYPRVVGKSVGLPSMLVFVAVTVGGNAWGILGMLFAVPICTVLYTLLGRFLDKKEAERDAKAKAKESEASDAGGEER